MRLSFCRLLVLVLSALFAHVACAAPEYQIHYRIGFLPESGEASVAIRIEPGAGRAQRLRFSIDGERHHGFEGDGKISLEGEQLTWRPGKKVAELRYRYRVDRERSDGAFDARMTDSWALFRVDKLIPPVAVLAPGGAVSKASMSLDLVDGWTHFDTAYLPNQDRSAYPINNPGRRFQRPLGWMIVGDIGTRTEQLDEMKVSVGAPKGDSLRRNDVLAVVMAVTVEMQHAFGELPEKLLIVGAGDPMWRGGLSGPRSLFLHSDRPLISENGSSTLVHEMVHVVSGIRGAKGDDWIAEGLAEYYSIEMLRRSGLISESRSQRAFRWMKAHGRKTKTLHSSRSHGRRTAAAVGVFHALDRELRSASDDEYSLDELIRPLVGEGRISTDQLRDAAEQLIGRPAKALQTPLLDP